MNELLLYSGGLDSVCAADFHLKAELVYVHYHGKNCDRELMFAQQAAGLAGRVLHVVRDRLNLSGFETGDVNFLPNRNAFLILTAVTCFGNERWPAGEETGIILNATAGDIHPDKDARFAELMENLLNHMNRSETFRFKTTAFGARTYKVLLPTLHMTKYQIVKKYKEGGGSIPAVRASVSCHELKYRECGNCLPCVRKQLSLAYNDIEPSVMPNKKTLSDVLLKCHAGTWCNGEEETNNTLDALAKLGF